MPLVLAYIEAVETAWQDRLRQAEAADPEGFVRAGLEEPLTAKNVAYADYDYKRMTTRIAAELRRRTGR